MNLKNPRTKLLISGGLILALAFIMFITLMALSSGCGRTYTTSYTPPEHTIDATTNCQMGLDIYRNVYDDDNVGFYPDVSCEINFQLNGVHSYTLMYADVANEVRYTKNQDGTQVTFKPWDFGAVMVVTRDYAGNQVENMTLYIMPVDSDKDGVWDHEDNCYLTWNQRQWDWDNDGIGNVCDNDWDNDRVKNKEDNCPWTWNPRQVDEDNDGIGDACDKIICMECDGQVTTLTLKYYGEKSYFKFVQHDGQPVFHGWLSEGDHLTLNGLTHQGTLGPKVNIFKDCEYYDQVHTSCSTPICPGLKIGDFLVLKGKSRYGDYLCAVE